MNTVVTCPECAGGWTLVELVTWAQELTMSYDAAAKCPRCGIETVWTSDGEIAVKTKTELVEAPPEWVGKKGKPEFIECACGCEEKFWTTHHDQFYKNNTHRTRGKRKGIVVDTRKRNKRHVRSRERTKGQL